MTERARHPVTRPRTARVAVAAAAAATIAVLTAACSSGSTGTAAPAPAVHRAAVSPATVSPATARQAAPAAASASPAAVAASPAAVVAAPKPAPVNPCAKNTHRQLVRVSLAAQHLWMCARTHLVDSTPITSGMSGADTETPRGHYTIQGLNRNSVLTLDTGKQYDVKYWIPFNAPLFGFHDSSWQDFPYGSPKYKTDGSHGCVHMPLKAIAFLYRWADIGASVTIA